MEAVAKEPISGRISMRAVVFFLVVGVLVGYPLYVYIDSVVSGGIHDAGDGYKEVDLKAMSVFPFDQTAGTINEVPQKWRALDGQKIICTGEMWQPYSAGRTVDGFQLVYSISKCCFNGPPQIQHFVQCTVMQGKQVEYLPNLVRVKGVLRVNVTKDPETGKITGVYHMDVESVEQV